MSRTWRPLLAVASLAFGAGLSSAVQAAEPGVYLGLTIGKADGSGPAYKEGADPSLGLAVGWRVNEQLAVEGFTRELSFIRFPELFGRTDAYQIPDRHVGLAVEGTLALSEGWGVFGRAGIGRTKMVGSTTGRRLDTVTDPTLGAGLRYGLGSGWAFKLGAERYGKSKVNAYYLALQYQF
ncbi:porin family protein [Mitsuaria sp. WAJ17]|uniref:porin family protein n=1 Tax=Mitsuaria sp. WAJ17 TaxID=2761452 RepID=UPI001601106D|nr:porin family protein [Mitsuaria sp. WAJ17]MBB2483797.1 porin family protein [Mitsuaria sp. WAJ17]